MSRAKSTELGLVLPPSAELVDGQQVLAALIELGQAAIRQFTDSQAGTAAIGRIRGTGPGVSFGELVARLEADLPIQPRTPFEGAQSIAGAIWPQPAGGENALAKLEFAAGTDRLPLHLHAHSDRFIMVLDGRGLFHVTEDQRKTAKAGRVRSIPIRSRDALVFRRGTLHTFSTQAEPLVLLSLQCPFIPFDDPRQYTVPDTPWYPTDLCDPTARVACDPAWNVVE